MKRDPLIRLRNANPVPLVPAVDGGDLFARITTSAPDSRLALRARPFIVRRPVVAIAVVFAGGAGLASTAVGLSSGWFESAPVKPPVTRHEYRVAQHQLTLPPGYSWPSYHIDPKSVTGLGAGGGHAVGVAQDAWSCYWVDAIRSGDTVAQQRAHAELVALLRDNVIVAPNGAPENWTPPNPPKGPYAVFADDGGYQWLQKAYADAAAGHPQNLIDYCRANKPG
jgi:hypothetical protein